MKEKFRHFACKATDLAGSATAFWVALGIVVAWIVSGPFFHYSDTWQLVINTGTTIVTFLMVFLIQQAQNRDTKAMQLKLNELLRGVKGARDEFVDIEEMSDEDLQKFRDEFKEMYLSLHSHAEKRGLPKTKALPDDSKNQSSASGKKRSSYPKKESSHGHLKSSFR